MLLQQYTLQQYSHCLGIIIDLDCHRLVIDAYDVAKSSLFDVQLAGEYQSLFTLHITPLTTQDSRTSLGTDAEMKMEERNYIRSYKNYSIITNGS